MTVKKDLALVFDCGATNVRVIAMDTRGNIIASESISNETTPDPSYPGGLIWDLNTIWYKLCSASKNVTSQIDSDRIAGVTVTSFGVDGTLVNEEGQMLYPIISWQCKRTEEVMASVDKYLPLEDLYKQSGIYPYAFNTINKLIWFKEHHAPLLKKAHSFVFISSILLHKLTGEYRNDITMAGTSMLMDAGKRIFSSDILSKIGLDSKIFGNPVEPGEWAGIVGNDAHKESGIPPGTSVFFGGHDTQFAVFGSGADLNQPILSSGTWEALMVRSSKFKSGKKELRNAITTELDAQKGLFNIGQHWLGSGVLEWFSRNFYPELNGNQLYETMIREAMDVEPGSHGLSIDPAFYNDSGNPGGGLIGGLTINSNRSQLYRALLESLACRLREGLEALQDAGDFRAEKIICVGGGSKNKLWNQLRADVCNLPIELIEQKETTVLGAALFVFAGAGLYKSVDDARSDIFYNPKIVSPSTNTEIYRKQFTNYLKFKK